MLRTSVDHDAHVSEEQAHDDGIGLGALGPFSLGVSGGRKSGICAHCAPFNLSMSSLSIHPVDALRL